jgi:glyoxylase-like metal-dependent hydrolase (beta-lactamase superfamily II)
MLVAVVVGNAVFTGDTLFKARSGGVRAPGHTTLRRPQGSIMDVADELPPDTDILPGHHGPDDRRDELETQPFVRVWRGLDPEGDEPGTAMGEPATLILSATDYDGGTKAWVRWRTAATTSSRVQVNPHRPRRRGVVRRPGGSRYALFPPCPDRGGRTL